MTVVNVYLLHYHHSKERAKVDYNFFSSQIVASHNPLTHCTFWTALLDLMDGHNIRFDIDFEITCNL